MAVKAILADQEKGHMMQIENLLAELWPDLVVCGRATSGEEALDLIDQHNPQLAILEVRLPGICGMQVARKVNGKCQVVFTTSYERYAVNAYDSGALDYLLKPVSRARLQTAVRRAKRVLLSSGDDGASVSKSYNRQQRFHRLVPDKPDYLQWLCTQQGRGTRMVSVDDVCYFKAQQKFTSVFTRTGENLITKSIKSLAAELDPDRFWRIHRSTIVNVSQIDYISRTQTGRGAVRLKDRSEVLIVSRSYLHLFKQM
ncbi:MAG: LytTR family DNA-binding domain-containing protein [Desulfobacteraceae bacterium]|jgi:DNA-binding LytR/AlgR family response regulator